MSKPVTVSWKGEGLLFKGVAANGQVDLASGLDEPGQGPHPCSSWHCRSPRAPPWMCSSILVKMRQPVRSFSVEVGGERAEEHPKRFLSLHVTYRLAGALDEAKVQRAIHLSESKYCSVEATLRDAVPISSEYVIEP